MPVSGSASILAVASGLKPPIPHAVSTTHSLRTVLSMDFAIDDLVEAASTVIRAARPTPTISADAVADVRRGFRMAFSRAILPATPRRIGKGAPMTRANGRAITGPSTATPTKTTRAPRATDPNPPPERPA